VTPAYSAAERAEAPLPDEVVAAKLAESPAPGPLPPVHRPTDRR
jgi:hypothetical protein